MERICYIEKTNSFLKNDKILGSLNICSSICFNDLGSRLGNLIDACSPGIVLRVSCVIMGFRTPCCFWGGISEWLLISNDTRRLGRSRRNAFSEIKWVPIKLRRCPVVLKNFRPQGTTPTERISQPNSIQGSNRARKTRQPED